MSIRRNAAHVFRNGFGRAVVIAVVGLGIACDDGVMTPPNDSEASVTVSNANPADGNGTLDTDTAIVRIFAGVGVQDLHKVTISGYDTSGAIAHELEILWLPATAEIQLCQHFWTPTGGATSGSTRCASGTANACDPATISVNTAQKTISLNGILLQDVFGGDATSTLTGTVVWTGDPTYDDH